MLYVNKTLIDLTGIYSNVQMQEKLNEAVMVLNKSLQVGIVSICKSLKLKTDQTIGNQRAEYERRACSTDVQKLPVKCAVPSGRSVH
jgi:hypothetical protein